MVLQDRLETAKWTVVAEAVYVMVNVWAVRDIPEVVFNTGRGRSPSLVCENDRGIILYAPRRRTLTIL